MGEMSARSRSVTLMPRGVVMSCRGEMEPRTGRAVVDGTCMVRIKPRRRMVRLWYFEGCIAARGCRLMLMQVCFKSGRM